MTEDLIINGMDAYDVWGVRMGDKFLDTLNSPAPLKEFIENKSRLEHGKRVDTSNTKLDERELTLTFTIEGDTSIDYQAKRDAFYSELYKGKIDINIPENGVEVYHLLYLGKSITYAQSLDRTFGKISAKFVEFDPSNRIRKD